MGKLNLKSKNDNDNKESESKNEYIFFVLIGKKKVKKKMLAENELSARMLLYHQLKDKEKVKNFSITDCI